MSGSTVRQALGAFRDRCVARIAEIGNLPHTPGVAQGLTPERIEQLVPIVVDVYGGAYPEIRDRMKTILAVIENEEKAYEDSCRRAEGARQGSMSVDEFAFMLYDTYGLPTDKIKDKFSKDGLTFNEAKFAEYLNQQKEFIGTHRSPTSGPCTT